MTTDILVEKQQNSGAAGISPSPPLGRRGSGEVGGAPVANSRANPTSPSRPPRVKPASLRQTPRRPLPLPPQAGGEGQGLAMREGLFSRISAGNSLPQCSSLRTRLRGIAVFPRRQRTIFASRSRPIFWIRMAEAGRRQRVVRWAAARSAGLSLLLPQRLDFAPCQDCGATPGFAC